MTQAIDAALEAVKFLKQFAADTYDYWDSDYDSKVGKRLHALAGQWPMYAPKVTEAYEKIEAALQAMKAPTDMEKHNKYFMAEHDRQRLQGELYFVYRWVERAVWNDRPPKEMLDVIISYPAAPWNRDRKNWDTAHLSYDKQIDADIARLTQPPQSDILEALERIAESPHATRPILIWARQALSKHKGGA